MVTVINAYTLSECMEAVADAVETYEREGQKNLVFCEDRLTLVAERAILRRTGGTFLSNVTTFARFLKTDRTVLSRQGSVMAVGDIMTALQNEGKLRCFLSADSVARNADCIYEQLAQFGASEITPDGLRESVDGMEEDALKNKMRDLELIYARYDEFLKSNGYLDEGKYLSLLPECLKNTTDIGKTNVFFLCYTSFTAQAMKTLAAAIENAANVVGVFCSGDEAFYTGQALVRFSETAARYGEYRVLNKGVPLSGEAEILRKGLFSHEALKEDLERKETERIRIFAAADKNAEAEYIAVNIRKMLMENPSMRYRDFAVLVSDVGAYSLALKKTFKEYGIPFFIDEKKSLKSHPISRFILDCFEVVKEGYSPIAVDSLLSSVVFGGGDGYRNYLLKYGNYRGGALREIKRLDGMKAEEREELVAYREKLLKATKPLKRRALGKEYCQAVRAILKELNAENAVDELAGELEDIAEKDYLTQSYKKLDGVVSEAELLTAERELSVAEFAAVLEDGLDATEISLIPLKLDAVFVGDITDSRIERVGVLFAAGMTDAVPRTSDDANLVTDKDKEKLLKVKTVLEPMVAEVNDRNREQTCLNLCTFTDRLFLTYPLGTDGEDPALSDIFPYVKNLFSGADGNRLREEKSLSDSDFPYLCSSRAPAIRRLPIEVSAYKKRQTVTRTKYSSLYAALLGETDLDALIGERDPLMTVENSAGLFFGKGTLSPTTLEGYFACPYQNFVARGLKMQDRDETAVMAVDTGNFIHDLLEKTTGKIEEFSEEEKFAEYAKEVGTSLMNDQKFLAMQETGAGAYSAEKLLSEGVTVVRAVYRQVKNSSFKVVEREKWIETDEFHGKVDRVDESEDYVRIIDYKTGKIDASTTAYYMGRKIQLELYMSAVSGDKEPAGVFYFPAVVSFTDDEDGKFRMEGFLSGDEKALKAGDNGITDEKKSEYFHARLSKNGRLEKVMDGETFRDFLDYAGLVAGVAKTEMQAGFVAPSPAKDSCRYCKYGGMCGFDAEVFEERKETEIRPKTVADIAKKCKGGE